MSRVQELQLDDHVEQDARVQARQGFDDRLVLNRPKLGENYMRGQLALHFHVVHHDGTGFCGVVWGGHSEYDPDVRLGHDHRENRSLVLVRVVQPLENGKEVVPALVRCRKMVGLQPLDRCCEVSGDAGYLSLKGADILWLRGPVYANGKLCFLARGTKGRYEMVECGAHLVNSLTDHDARPDWYDHRAERFLEVLTSLQVVISNDVVRYAADDFLNVGMHLSDVCLGPL